MSQGLKHQSNKAKSNPITALDLLLRQPEMKWFLTGNYQRSATRIKRFMALSIDERVRAIGEIASAISGRSLISPAGRLEHSQDVWLDQQSQQLLADYLERIDLMIRQVNFNRPKGKEFRGGPVVQTYTAASSYGGIIQAISPFKDSNQKDIEGNIANRVASVLVYGLAEGFTSPMTRDEAVVDSLVQPYVARTHPLETRGEVFEAFTRPHGHVPFGFSSSGTSLAETLESRMLQINPHTRQRPVDDHRNISLPGVQHQRIQAWLALIDLWSSGDKRDYFRRTHTPWWDGDDIDIKFADDLATGFTDAELPSYENPIRIAPSLAKVDGEIIGRLLLPEAMRSFEVISSHKEWIEAGQKLAVNHPTFVEVKPILDENDVPIVSALGQEVLQRISVITPLGKKPNGGGSNFYIEVGGCENEIASASHVMALLNAASKNTDLLARLGIRGIHAVATNPDGMYLNEDLQKMIATSFEEVCLGEVRGIIPAMQASWSYSDARKKLDVAGPKAMQRFVETFEAKDSSILWTVHQTMTQVDGMIYVGRSSDTDHASSADPIVHLLNNRPERVHVAAPDGDWIERDERFANPRFPTPEMFERNAGLPWTGGNALWGLAKPNDFGALIDLVIYEYTPHKDLFRTDLSQFSNTWNEEFDQLSHRAGKLLHQLHPSLKDDAFNLDNYFAKSAVLASAESTRWSRPSDANSSDSSPLARAVDAIITNVAITRRVAAIARRGLLWSHQQNTNRPEEVTAQLLLAKEIETALKAYAQIVNLALKPKPISIEQTMETLTIAFGRFSTANAISYGIRNGGFIDPRILTPLEHATGLTV